jgi:hypothetical protein
MMKDNYIEQQKRKMDEMCEIFVSMMRNAHALLTETISFQGHDSGDGGTASIQELLNSEEFSYKLI